MDNNTLCNSVEEVFRVKVLGFYIYFLMIINTSFVVWYTIGNYSENNQVVQKDDKYSLKFVLISNFVSFMSGLVVHYLTDHN